MRRILAGYLLFHGAITSAAAPDRDPMTLKVDLENYRERPHAGGPAARAAPAGVTVNWKIVRALGLALLVWALIAAVLFTL
jgi:hypothetical protein